MVYSPSRTPVMTTDENHTRTVLSPIQACSNSPENTRRSQTSSNPPAASPIPSPFHSPATSMPATQSKIQPNSPSQNRSTSSILVNSNTSCLLSPETAPSLRCDQPVKISSQSLHSGIEDHASLSTHSRHSITPSLSFPGASGAATTYDRIFPDSADSHHTLHTVSSTESLSAASQRTPNVYINGLPPHLSEQDLFALARPFGDIKSVRTFTRHVSEKPTGYGFVLFGDADSAQRCIDGLRKYRNLHPSFSKQVHRIPGTEYAQHHSAQSMDQDEHTFKSRMEKLKDVTSTNLYIEGLPLSIDEESLAALMMPYKIKSSRFFKTKLSNPPRIIAFVRLETRAAAEDTIERLHGRMVRGWNDPGCRISVRFADSAEQRELRRAERSLKNEDQSPSRLTIAQAALLNLRGQELQSNIRNTAGGKPLRPSSSRSDAQTSFIPGMDPGLFPSSRSLPTQLCRPYTNSPLLSTPLPIASETDTLLQSTQNMGYDDFSLETAMGGLALENNFLMSQQAQLRALASATLISPNSLPVTLPRGHAQACNGFTPAEELILEAHAQRLQLQSNLSQSPSILEQMSALRKPGLSGRSFSDSSSLGLFQAPILGGSTAFSRDAMPSVSEDDFHALRHPLQNFASTSKMSQGEADHSPSIASSAANTIFARPPSRAVTIVPPPPDYEEQGKRSKGLPRAERSVGSKQASFSTALFSDSQPIPPVESILQPSMLHAPTRPNNVSKGSNDKNNSTSTNSREKHTYMYPSCDARSFPEEDKEGRFRSLTTSHMYTKKSPQLREHPSTNKDDPKSPAIVSPALTYSSRTSSTLSPATPFFGSFVGGQDAFEGMAMEGEDVVERKLKEKVSSK